jgi:hypothetical protein
MTIQSIVVRLLRPTQIAVGKRLVRAKRKDLRGLERKPQELVDYIVSHPIRVVLGPKSNAYIIDHHHLGCALLKESFLTAPVQVEADLSAMELAEFWAELAKRFWVYPYDGTGKKHAVSDIPQRLEDMEDDPYRSLAGFVREAGGFIKTMTPYMEFQWARYFRPLVKLRALESDFKGTVQKAKVLAAKPEARGLPGYIGPK